MDELGGVMRGGSRGFLARLGEEVGRSPLEWKDLLIVMNTGPVVPSHRVSGDRISNRGFNAVLLFPPGVPSHYLKVRHQSHEDFLKETEVHRALAGDPSARGLVPEGSSFSWDPARILVSRFQSGGTLQTILQDRRGMSPWSQIMDSVFEQTAPFWAALNRISDRGGSSDPGPSPEPANSQTLAQVRRDLADLTAAGLGVATVRELERAMRGRDLPAVPQHGDFWPRNLIRSGDGWKVLDLEACGSMDLPLYDAFHLLRGSVWAAGGKGAGIWMEWWRKSRAGLNALNEHVADQMRGADPGDGEVAMVAYHASFALRLMRRGLPENWIRPWIRELERLPAVLREGSLRAVLEAIL